MNEFISTIKTATEAGTGTGNRGGTPQEAGQGTGDGHSNTGPEAVQGPSNTGGEAAALSSSNTRGGASAKLYTETSATQRSGEFKCLLEPSFLLEGFLAGGSLEHWRTDSG